MAKWLKDNAVNLLMLVLTAGTGGIAFALDAGTMLSTFPLQAILLALFAFLLGGLVFRYALVKSKRAKDKRILEKVKGLSPQLIAEIQRAYTNGCYPGNFYDTNVQYLLGLGFLGAPQQVAILGETPFMLQPWFKNFLDRHHEEIFGK